MKTTSVGKVNIPDGKYQGKISGYTVTVSGYEDFPIETKVGVKGMGISCTITIEAEYATIEIY